MIEDENEDLDTAYPDDEFDQEPEEPFIDGPLRGEFVRIDGWGAGIAFVVVEDDGENWVKARMVGDDRYHRVDRDDCKPLKRKEFCMECGQTGCGCCVIDDEEEDA